MIDIPQIAIFATGSREGGGSGSRILLEKIKSGEIKANINKIVTNYPKGGVVKLSDEYSDIVSDLLIKDDFPKREKDGEFNEKSINEIKKFYQNIIEENNLDYIFLSGWMKQVLGILAEKVINIHPGPIASQGYGGKGMHGLNVHKKIWEDYEKGKITHSCVTMHYATEEFDDGPIIIQVPVDLELCESIEDIGSTVNNIEHMIQWKVTELIISGTIKWSGKKGDKLEILDQEKIDNYCFPKGTVFGKTIELNQKK